MPRLLVQLTESEFRALIEDAFQMVLIKQGSKDRPPPRYLTRKQVAEMLHITLMTLNEWRKKGILKPKYIGGRALYSSQQIEKILENQK
jgi:hypothetical protein